MTILTALVGLAVGWLLPQPVWFTVLVATVKTWWAERKNK